MTWPCRIRATIRTDPPASRASRHVPDRALLAADEAEHRRGPRELAGRPDARADLAVEPEALDLVGLHPEHREVEVLAGRALGRQVHGGRAPAPGNSEDRALNRELSCDRFIGPTPLDLWTITTSSSPSALAAPAQRA